MISFQNDDEKSEFQESFKLLKSLKKMKNSEFNDLKNNFNSNARRYSWLTQPFISFSNNRSETEYFVNIINEKFSPAKQILQIDLVRKTIAFLKKEKQKVKIKKNKEIYYFFRKLSLKR